MIDMFGIFGIGGMLIGGGFMILFWVAVVFLIIWLYRQITGTQDVVESENTLEILKVRYARGEITIDEFEEMKKDLLT
jgi:putative membrane protein